MDISFREIEYSVAVDFLMPRHYAGRIPSISYAFGMYVDNELYAVSTFGSPASAPLIRGVAGEKWKNNVIELNRLCREEKNINIPLSMFVSWCLRQLKPKNLIVVSYSDTEMNHHGYIYQACNFYYSGCTKERTDKYTEGNKHCRHYDNDLQNTGLRKVRSAKHRYIFIAANKRIKKEMLNDIKYPLSFDYPKGDNSTYVLGDYLKPHIVKMGANGYERVEV